MTITVLNTPYCIPYFNTGCEIYNIGITNFQLKNIAQMIECTGNPSYYHDYTSSSTNLDPDSTYTITVTGGSYNMFYSVWIDYNQDLIFDFASEMVGYAYCQAFLNSSFEFTVDGDALPGTTRLRVMSRYESYGYPTDPCSSYEDYGNCADFGINVNQPVYMIWTGMVSDEWNNPGNWNEPAVPGATDKVLVPSAPAGGNVFPVVPVSGGPYSIRRLTIETGATVTLTSGSLLNISDD